MPDPALPCVVDPANDLLAAGGAATLLTGMNEHEVGIITIRTPTTTLTVQLPRGQVLAWGAMITELGEELGGSGLLVATRKSALLRP